MKDSDDIGGLNGSGGIWLLLMEKVVLVVYMDMIWWLRRHWLFTWFVNGIGISDLFVCIKEIWHDCCGSINGLCGFNATWSVLVVVTVGVADKKHDLMVLTV